MSTPPDRNHSPSNEELGRELDAIKRLLILALFRAGASANEVATAMGVSPATVSRLMPKRQLDAMAAASKKTDGTSER